MKNLKKIPLVTIDLSLTPEERWHAISSSMRRSAKVLSRRIDQEVPASVRWLIRAVTKFRNPFRPDIEALASIVGVRLGTALAGNLAYELTSAYHALPFGCTCGAADYPKLGLVHVRTLDWPMEELGRYTVIFKFKGAPAGPFYSVGWPSFVGVLSGMAPGRFSASINFAARGRWQIGSLQWPPSHLLRDVFENCHTYESAAGMIRDAEFCAPTLITLVGTKPGEAAIIECSGQRNRVYRMRGERPIAVANDYLSSDLRHERDDLDDGTKRGDEIGEEAVLFEAPRRKANLLRRLRKGGFSSLKDTLRPLNSYPVLNDETRLQVSMSAARGELAAYGIDRRKRFSFGATGRN